MKKEIFRYIKLYLGLFICSLGAVTVLKSDMGLPPWDVLHQGISMITGITIGQASISIGVIIVLLDVFLGQPIGIGSVINFIFIGLFMDFIIYMNFVPEVNTVSGRILELVIGIFFYTYGTYLYMIQGMGCGPRDGFMQILTQKFNLPVSLVKNSIEIIAFGIGWLLGGKLGIGTVATALIMGILLEWMFKIGKIDIKNLRHRSIKEEMVHLKDVINHAG
ncbi:YczE/YyaS/YitT family protein [Fusobacterium sp.]|uniref:YczE/YyaS/YitT family protein n=1 Tax=Fusobacterium sp. TaxID=68766 RepID=UPI00396CB112